MWGFDIRKNILRERMLLNAPEADPHQFVRHYLMNKSRSRSKQVKLNGRQVSPTGPRSDVVAKAMAANGR